MELTVSCLLPSFTVPWLPSGKNQLQSLAIAICTAPPPPCQPHRSLVFSPPTHIPVNRRVGLRGLPMCYTCLSISGGPSIPFSS